MKINLSCLQAFDPPIKTLFTYLEQKEKEKKIFKVWNYDIKILYSVILLKNVFYGSVVVAGYRDLFCATFWWVKK